MSNKNKNKLVQVTYTRPVRKLGIGDWKMGSQTLNDAFKGEGASWMGEAGNALGSMIGSGISNGLESGAGNAIGALGNIASNIPGPWGAAVSGGLQVVGGLTNAAFGSKLNQENIDHVKDVTAQLNATTSNLGDYDALVNNMNNGPTAFSFDKNYIGKDGWFSNKAKNEYKKLKEQMELAAARQQLSYNVNADQIAQNTMNNLQRKYIAYGGPLFAEGGSLVNNGTDIFSAYDEAQSEKKRKQLQEAYAEYLAKFAQQNVKEGQDVNAYYEELADNEGLMQYFMQNYPDNVSYDINDIPLEYNVYAKGGSIHINPKNKGKFTAAAKKAGMGVQEYASHVLANKDKYSPTLVKRANFAKNTTKFNHHDDGGFLDYIEKTAKNRAPIRAPRLDPTEEDINLGMAILMNDPTYNYRSYYNNTPELFLNYGLDHWPDTYKTAYHPTFSNESIYSGKKSQYNPEGIKGGVWLYPTDPLMWDPRVKHIDMENHFYPSNNQVVTWPAYKFGGELNTNGADFTNGLLSIENGGTHEENPLQGIPMGTDNEGTPNLVEEGETIYNDYVFSRRLKIPKELNKRYGFGGKQDVSFAQASKKLAKESEERPNDPISQRGLDALLGELTVIQEMVKSQNQEREQQANMAKYGGLINKFDGDDTDTNWLNLPYFDYYNTLLPINNGYEGPLNNPKYTNEVYKINIPIDWDAAKKTANAELKTNIANYQSAVTKANSSSDNRGSLISNWIYAPVAGSAIANISDALGLTNKADYTNANAAINAGRNRRNQTVGFSPIGGKLAYRPLDRLYQANLLNAQANATRRALLQNAGLSGGRGTGMSAILAADKNATSALGQAYIAGQQYNDQLRQQIAKYNAGIDEFNAEGMLKADMANQSAYESAADSGLRAIQKGLQMREDERNAVELARANNFNNLFTNLGNVGKQMTNYAFMKWAIENGVFPAGSETFDAYGGKLKRKKK